MEKKETGQYGAGVGGSMGFIYLFGLSSLHVRKS